MDQSAPQLITGPAKRTIFLWTIITLATLLGAGVVAPIMMRAQVTTGTIMGSDAYAAWLTFHGTALMFSLIVSLAGLQLSIVRSHLTPMHRFEFLDLGASGFVVLGLGALAVGAASDLAATGGWVGYAPLRSTIFPSTGRGFGRLDVWALTIAAAGCAALLLSVSSVLTLFLSRGHPTTPSTMALRRGTTSFAVALGLMSPLFLLASGSLFWAIHGGATFFDFTSGGDPARWDRAVEAFSGIYHVIIAIPALTVVCWLARKLHQPGRWLDRIQAGAFVALALSPLLGWLAFGGAHVLGTESRFPVPLTIFTITVLAVAVTCIEGLHSSLRLGWPEGWASVATLGLYGAHIVVSGWMTTFTDMQQVETQVQVARNHLLYLGGPVLGTIASGLILWPRLTQRETSSTMMTSAIAAYSLGVLTLTGSMIGAGAKGMPMRMYRSDLEFGYGRWLFIGNLGFGLIIIAIGVFLLGLGLSRPQPSCVDR